jgi:hypothetical protein
VLLGRFLELAIPTARPLDSLEFYRQLGLSVASDTGADESTHVVVSDGRLSIALCDHRLRQPTLVFVCRGFAARIEPLEQAGLVVDEVAIGEHRFNRLDAHLRHGPHLRLVEARTHSPVAEQPSALGWFNEITVPASRMDVRSMESLGFVALECEGLFGRGMALTSDSISLGLNAPGGLSSVWLHFECADLDGLRRALHGRGIEEDHSAAPELDRHTHIVVQAPEGTMLVARRGD